MGSAKHELERLEEARAWATRELLKRELIEECEIHEGTYIDLLGGEEPEDLATQINALPDCIKDRDELVKALRGALDDAGMECGSCAKNAED